MPSPFIKQGFAGTVAFVTGAASGIGFAVAEALAGKGAHVVLTDLDRAKIDDAVGRLASAGAASLTGAVLDVSDAAAFQAAIDDVDRSLGRVDLLVNNAGTAVGGETQDLEQQHWDRVLDVNLKGVAYGVMAAYPGMVHRRFGHIVNVASLTAFAPSPLMVPYSASKAGVLGLSLALRAEASGHGVGVTAVCPGIIETPLLERSAPDGLQAPKTAPDTRRWVTQASGKPYPAERLAADVLAAVRADKAMLVVPRAARATWLVSRVAPRALLAGGRLAVARERRRAGRRTGRQDPHPPQGVANKEPVT